VIGDHLIADIGGAKRAGLAAILVLTGTTSRADLDRAEIKPDVVLESIAALPSAMRAPDRRSRSTHGAKHRNP
jgi:phospholysine phosphohistidine inorganic pyrophosphate phosphatase